MKVWEISDCRTSFCKKGKLYLFTVFKLTSLLEKKKCPRILVLTSDGLNEALQITQFVRQQFIDWPLHLMHSSNFRS